MKIVGDKETYKLVLAINKESRQRVFDERYYKEINLDWSVIERGQEFKLLYTDGSIFATNEEVEYIDPFYEYGLKVVTVNNEWYIY